MNFPCEFVLKVMGTTEAQLETALRPILDKHIKDLEDIHITTNPSQGGKYVSVTVTFTAHNQEQLDNLYREISAHPDVLMAL